MAENNVLIENLDLNESGGGPNPGPSGADLLTGSADRPTGPDRNFLQNKHV